MSAHRQTVFLVDDHPVMRAGIAATLERIDRFIVCGEAGTAAEARDKIAALKPDIVVFDLILGGRDGVALIQEIKVIHPGARVLVYSSYDEILYARRALRVGAQGYLMKTSDPQHLCHALARIAEGQRVMSRAVQEALLEETLSSAGEVSPIERLSNQELQVLRLLADGFGLGEIAAEMNLSVKTIGTYRERLKNKLGVDSARDLARKASVLIERNS